MIEKIAFCEHADHGDGISVDLDIGGLEMFSHIDQGIVVVQFAFIAEAHEQIALLGLFDAGSALGIELIQLLHRSGTNSVFGKQNDSFTETRIAGFDGALELIVGQFV